MSASSPVAVAVMLSTLLVSGHEFIGQTAQKTGRCRTACERTLHQQRTSESIVDFCDGVLTTAAVRALLAGINSFLFIGLVLVCLLLGGIIKRYNFHYLPESGASMLFGLICGGILNLSERDDRCYPETNALQRC